MDQLAVDALRGILHDATFWLRQAVNFSDGLFPPDAHAECRDGLAAAQRMIHDPAHLNAADAVSAVHAVEPAKWLDGAIKTVDEAARLVASMQFAGDHQKAALRDEAASMVEDLRERGEILFRLQSLEREEGAEPQAPDHADKTAKRRKRRKKQTPLTPTQAATVQVVTQCNGDIAAAAKRMNKDPKTVRQAYSAALAKLPGAIIKPAKKPMPQDRRGQDAIAAEDDKRRG